jgi:hypothetical protein
MESNDPYDANDPYPDPEGGVNFEVEFVGSKRNSKVYRKGIYGYHKESISKSGLTYVCCVFKKSKSCKARGVIDSGILEETGKHTCLTTETDWKAKEAANTMRKKAAGVPDDLSKIHRTVLSGYDAEVGAKIPFTRIKSSLKKARRKR